MSAAIALAGVTNYNPAQEVKLSDIMKHVRKCLEKGSEFYICHIISDMSHQTPGTFEQKRHLKEWIRSMLELCGAYGSWLQDKHPELYGRYKDMSKAEKARSRLPWVDWMIAELEKTGE